MTPNCLRVTHVVHNVFIKRMKFLVALSSKTIDQLFICMKSEFTVCVKSSYRCFRNNVVHSCLD